MRWVLFALAAFLCTFSPQPNFVCALPTASPQQQLPSDAPVFDIPRVSGLQLDGGPAEWGDNGFRVESFACAHGQPWPRAYPPPTMRLAWDDRGILALVTVHDAHPHEFDYVRNLFKADSVEFFVSTGSGSHDRYMLVISPGLDPRYPQVRHCFFLDPAEEGEREIGDLNCTIARKPTGDGYTMEVLLPWSNLKMKPVPGLRLGLQAYVMDAEDHPNCVTSMWHLAGDSHIDPDAVFDVRLAEKPSDPFLISAAVQKRAEKPGTLSVRIVGVPEMVGQTYDVAMGDKRFRGILASRGTQAWAAVELPNQASCSVTIQHKTIPMAIVPEDNLQDLLTQQIKCYFRPNAFKGTTFPRPVLEAASASATIRSTTYYDQDFNPVEVAQAPGRYEAVVELAIAGKTHLRRFCTLCRLPDDTSSAQFPAEPSAQFYAPFDSEQFKDSWNLLTQGSPSLLISYLTTDRPPLHISDSVDDDHRWWLALKRRLYGLDIRYPSRISCPDVLDGPAAPVLRDGTPAEAGITLETIAKLDSLFRFGVPDDGEPIAVCLARRGVIFFHHAYGQVDGRPMTVETPCDMQSQTKTLSGALMMMLVDRGLIHLDDPLAAFLPPFQGTHPSVPLTVRHLYTHLSGFHDSWGDDANDAEEVLGGCYPFLHVGTYCYNGTGFALGSKLIEDLSGELIHPFAKRHLLDPLGMSHTILNSSAAGAISTAKDYARFGQMLLNEGAYGQMRFFSARTFHRMLPVGGWGARGGIGLQYGPRNMLGHTAAHSGLFWIDPASKLVIVITSRGKQKVFARLENDMYDILFHGLQDQSH